MTAFRSPTLSRVALAFPAGVLVVACSLGDAVTPDCSLDGTDPNCDPAAACDDGQGGLVASESCCLLRANDEYELTCMEQGAAGTDYRLLCPADGTGQVACCAAAKKAYDDCLAAK